MGQEGKILIFLGGLFLEILLICAQKPEIRAVERGLPKATPAWMTPKLSPTAIEIVVGNDTPVHFHPAKTVHSIATKEQFQNGLVPDDFEMGTLVGLFEVHRTIIDYRNLEVPPGLYALRIAHQPDSDDHRDTAPGRMFFLLCPVEKDSPIPPKKLDDLLKRALIGNRKHASPWFGFVSKEKATIPLPALKESPPKHQSILWKQPVETEFGAGITVLGLTWKGPE